MLYIVYCVHCNIVIRDESRGESRFEYFASVCGKCEAERCKHGVLECQCGVCNGEPWKPQETILDMTIQ